MQKSKLLKILRTLSKTAFIQFRKVLQSPFFVSNEIPLQLYDAIRRYYPTFTSTLLSKERIFKKIYPDRNYKDAKMRAMLLRLTQLAEDFLVWQQVKGNEANFQKNLIKAYAERPLFEYYKKSRAQLIEKMQAEPFRDVDYYQSLFELHQAYYYHPQRQKFDPNDDTLEQLLESLDKRFILSKLRMGLEVKNQERIFQRKYDLRFFDVVQSAVTSTKENSLFQLYNQLYILLSGGDYETFQTLETTFFTHSKQFQTKDVQLIYFYSLNYIVRKVNEGKMEFSPKALEWYQFGLKDKLLIQNDKISEVSFGNIVVYGCREKAFEWTASFMKTFENRLRSQNPEDVMQFNLGLWHFYKGDLERAFSVLNHFDFHHSLQLKVRLTTLRVLFEQFLADDSYYDAIKAYALSYQKFINRTEFFSTSIAEPYKNAIELIKAITTKIWAGERKVKIQKWLNSKLHKQDKLAVKSWFILHAKNLKK